MASVLREKYGEKLQNIYPDASGKQRASAAPGGKSDFWYLRRAGFNVRAHPNNPARKDRYNAVNGKFKASDGKVSLTMSSRCRRLKKYCSVYSHELMNRTDQKAMSHLLDALGYPLAYLYPVDKDQFKVARLTGA